MMMKAQEIIRHDLIATLGWKPGEANAARIYKGHGAQGYGWYVQPFGERATWWGTNVAEVTASMDDDATAKRELG